MSVIGDYIHFKTSNYLKYGVSKNGQENLPSLSVVYQKQKVENSKRIKNLIDIDEELLNKLERAVVTNLKNKNIKNQFDFNKGNEIKLSKDFKQMLTNGIGKSLGNFEDAALKEEFLKKIEEVQNSLLKEENSIPEGNIKKAQQYRKNLYKNIDTINTHLSSSIQQRTINAFFKNLDGFFQALGLIAKDISLSSYLDRTLLEKQSVINVLKIIMQNFSFARAYKATVQGKFGEAVVAACQNQINGIANKTANGKILGDQVSKFALDSQHISREVKEIVREDTLSHLNLYQIHTSQDKVDVQILYQDKELNVSVKTYTPKNNIIYAHLQDVSLLTNLATTVEHYANHWLNLHCANEIINSRVQKHFDSALEEHIRYEALVSGNLLKQNGQNAPALANTYIVIDAEKGKVYVNSTKDLLLNNRNNFILNPKINDIHIKGNEWVEGEDGEYRRIARIIMNLHQTKVSVKLKSQPKEI